MSTNLVASVINMVTPELVSRIAAMVGVDRSVVEKAMSAGIPGVLAAFVSLVGRPGGAARLTDAVAAADPDPLASMANATPANQRDMIEGGADTLSSLLGAGTMSAITGALGRYTGLGDVAANGLMGLLGPMVMGALGREQRAGGLDASGMAQLLRSQAANINRALPSGFAAMLSDAGIGTQPATGTSRAREEAGSPWGWLAPVLGAIALVALGWYMLGRPHEPTVAQAPAPVTTAEVPEIIVTADEERSWVGRPVYSSDNQKVGEIIEIRRAPDNKVTDIFFDAGTFLGMGAKRYHVSTDKVAEVNGADGVVLKMDSAETKALPEAMDSKAPN